MRRWGLDSQKADWHISETFSEKNSFNDSSAMKSNNSLKLSMFNLIKYVYYVFTCVSDKLRFLASSFRSAPTTYWLFSKECSNFSIWLGLKDVRILFGLLNGSKNSGKWGPRIIRGNILNIKYSLIRQNVLFPFENPTMIHTAINPCQLLEQALEKIQYILLQTEWLESLPKD